MCRKSIDPVEQLKILILLGHHMIKKQATFSYFPLIFSVFFFRQLVAMIPALMNIHGQLCYAIDMTKNVQNHGVVVVPTLVAVQFLQQHIALMHQLNVNQVNCMLLFFRLFSLVPKRIKKSFLYFFIGFLCVQVSTIRNQKQIVLNWMVNQIVQINQRISL